MPSTLLARNASQRHPEERADLGARLEECAAGAVLRWRHPSRLAQARLRLRMTGIVSSEKECRPW